MRYIKMYGLPRTCTNLTEVIIKKNFKCEVLVNKPDWKHGFRKSKTRSIHDDKIDTDDLRFVVCTKHPYRWLWSLYLFEKNRWEKTRSVDDFLRKCAWHYRKRIDDPLTAIDAFNRLTKHWLETYNDEKILIKVKQEDLEKPNGQIKFCKKIKKLFDLTNKEKVYYPIEKVIKPGSGALNKLYKDKGCGFSKKQLSYIKANLDKDVVKMAGYKI